MFWVGSNLEEAQTWGRRLGSGGGWVGEPHFSNTKTSPVAQWVKNLPKIQETQETWVRSLGWEDPLGEEIATHSTILAWKIPWPEEPGGLESSGSQRVGHN